jgi:hypothetical protein
MSAANVGVCGLNVGVGLHQYDPLSNEKGNNMTEQATAIRAFFTDPKPTYTKRELEPIFAGDLPEAMMEGGRYGEVAESVDRTTVAAFIRSFVSPVIVGHACGDVVNALEIETITVELPKWMVDGLRNVARARSTSISDVIATEFVNGNEGVGFAADLVDEFSVDLPQYA